MGELVGAVLFVQLLPGLGLCCLSWPGRICECAGKGFLEAGGGESWAGEVVVLQVPVGIDSLLKKMYIYFLKNVMPLEFP